MVRAVFLNLSVQRSLQWNSCGVCLVNGWVAQAQGQVCGQGHEGLAPASPRDHAAAAAQGGLTGGTSEDMGLK